MPCDDWVIIGAMVTDQQKPGVLRHLFHATYINMDTQKFQRRIGGRMQKPAVIFTVILIITLWVHKQAADEQQQNKRYRDHGQSPLC